MSVRLRSGVFPCPFKIPLSRARAPGGALVFFSFFFFSEGGFFFCRKRACSIEQDFSLSFTLQ